MTTMDTSVFDAYRRLVYEKSGITLKPGKEALVSARVSKRIRALGLDRHEQYLEYLGKTENAEEVVQLIDAISTNVTSFFREPVHFDLLRELAGSWRQKGQDRFRVWSAASSSGEEPYSIALTLLDALDGKRNDIKILATDISTRMLSLCLRGEYTADKLRSVPAAHVQRFFTKANTGGKTAAYRVNPEAKNIITFKRLNLAAPPFPMKGPFDAIFCRNVMIYFDTSVRKGLLDEISRLLKPGGYLFVGHAESLTGMMTSLKSVRPSVYVKP